MKPFLILTVVYVFMVLACGCTPLTPATQKQISDVAQQTAIEKSKVQSAGDIAVEKIKAAASVNQIKGQDYPFFHQFDYLNNRVVEFTLWLRIAVVTLTLAAIAAFVVNIWLKLPTIDYLFAALWRVDAVAFVALITLPWLVWGILATVCAVIGLLIFQAIKNHLSIQKTIAAVKAQVGIPTTTATVSQTTTTASVTAPAVTTTPTEALRVQT